MPFNIGPFELLLVLILALLILGPGKLPEVGSAIGKTLREFRRATSEVDEAVKAADINRPSPAQPEPRPEPRPAARSEPGETNSETNSASSEQSRAAGS